MPAKQSGGINAKKSKVKVGRDMVGRDQIIVNPQPEASPYSSLPHQPFFFGRAKELATIADALAPESRSWGALIDGPGGIGKTALAVRAAYLAPSAQYPIKIFLSAKVRELTPPNGTPLSSSK